MDPVIHFEIPAEDRPRMIEFYNKAFGWQSNQLGQEFGDYVVVMTTETGPDNFPKEKGQINGGFFQRAPDSNVRVVIGIKDIHESMKKVEEAGGKITGGSNPGQPDDIPGVGLYIAFTDIEGNKMAMIQPNPMQSQAS